MIKFIKSFGYAIKGLVSALSIERNLRVQIGVATLTIGAGFYFDITATEWCIVILLIGFVIGLELVNTAIEDLVDLVTLEQKPLAGRVKDVAAGAVLAASIAAVIIGIIIFRKYLIQ